MVGVIFPTEEHLGFVDRHNAVVGDGYAVGVTSQIVQNVFGSAERWLGINDPILFTQGVQKCAEGFFLGQRQALSVKDQLLGAESMPQSGQEFPAEDWAEHQDRQEEVDGCGRASVGDRVTGLRRAPHNECADEVARSVPRVENLFLMSGWVVEDLRVQLDSRGFGVAGSSWQCGVAWILWLPPGPVLRDELRRVGPSR